MSFESVADGINFSEEEDKILAYWTKIDAFQTSYKLSEGRPEYTFYDGPPFATGLPHYGHILAGTIKDVVTRYAHQTGHRVSRRFGWDCHGLPVEYEIDKKLGIKGKDDVAAMGIDRYNAECRSIVMRYSKEWETIVTRMGRWIDFKNDYKTLDTPFMESVWWVFHQLYEKKLVYQGFKVMPYSTTCTTPLSNFEAGQNYKMVLDPAICVSFPVLPSKEYCFLAWTTTPWTLPSNLGLCVKASMDYVKVRDIATKAVYMLAEVRLGYLYPKKGAKKAVVEEKDDEDVPTNRFAKKVTEHLPSDTSKYEILATMKGSELLGLRYEPLFDYFAKHPDSKGFWQVMNDDYVTDDSGTGIVHQAPAFGEDDYRVCINHNVITRGGALVCPVDDDGNFTDDVTDFKGRNVKEADRDIVRLLTKAGRVIKNDQLNHKYPFCWRSDTPLIYKAVPSWFVNVPSIKEKLMSNNLKSKWVPKAVQEKRFANWLAEACDWSISRNRYWGTPLPIWTSEDYKEIVVVGSVKQLEELSGVSNITDLHRDKIDHITIPSKEGKGLLRRVPEVFDCWFESGSMPYAQLHYPFENKEQFDNGFPADFIAEGLDQTRGWFYTLMVISTALFDKPPFKNLIVNGLVLAENGKKMSKRLKNYPDPMLVVSSYGADALRLYLINSPVVRAEPLNFKEAGVKEVAREIFIPWFNCFRFFTAQARRWESVTGKKFAPIADIHSKTDNVMDKWILSALQTLVKEVRSEMAKYHLYTVIPHLVTFIDQLSRWYLRFNKDRLKSSGDACTYSLATLFEVLMSLCRLMGPFTPFITEHMYLNLRQGLPKSEQVDSVHYLMVPTENVSAIDTQIETSVQLMQAVIELGRTARDKANISFRVPVLRMTVIHTDQKVLDDVKSLEGYIKSQLNCRDLTLSSKVGEFVALKADPERRSLGKRFGKDMKAVSAFIEGLTHEQVTQLQSSGRINAAEALQGREEYISLEETVISSHFVGDTSKLEAQSKGSMLLVMVKELDEDCIREGQAREVMARVQQLRKKSGLNAEDVVDVWYEVSDPKWSAMLTSKAEYIQTGIRVKMAPLSTAPAGFTELTRESDSVAEGVTLLLVLTAGTKAAAPAKAAPAKKSSKKSSKKRSNKK